MLDPRLLNWQVHGWHLTELVPPTGKKIGVEFPIAISLKKQIHRQHIQLTLMMILTSVLVKTSNMSRKCQQKKQISTSYQQRIVHEILVLNFESVWFARMLKRLDFFLWLKPKSSWWIEVHFKLYLVLWRKLPRKEFDFPLTTFSQIRHIYVQNCNFMNNAWHYEPTHMHPKMVKP